MVRRYLKCIAAMALLSCSQRLFAAPYAEKPGSHQTATLEVTWQDAKRDRDVPIRIDYPKDLATFDKPAPIIIFSHGLGGTRDVYAEYGKHWASYGYVVVFPQHHGSDSAVIGHGFGEMLAGKNDLQPFLDRVADIHFVIDQLELLNAGKLKGDDYAILSGKLDLEKIGMSGHSFGAITTQAIVGQVYDVVGKTNTFLDKRVKAGIAMSGSGAKSTDQDVAFSSIKMPVFYLTGTLDKVGNIGAGQRRTPFDHSTFPETYLVTFDGANHMTFGPRGSIFAPADKEKYQKFIRQSTTAFWDAYLKGDAAAKKWFESDFKMELGMVGVFETKNATK
jgi:predicted dienelactone hydrolase